MNPQAPRPPTYDELLRATRRSVVDQLAALVPAVLGRVDDWLFDLAQKEGEGADPFARSPRLEAMNALRAHRATIERQFASHYEGLFDALIEARSEPAAAHLRLSLLGEQELEQQLASDLIAEALQRSHGHTLDALARGLARAVGVEALAARQNPLSPFHFGHAMHHAVQGIELPSMLQVVLYKYYERELLQGFSLILDPVVQRFTAAGLLPRMAAAQRAAPARPAQERSGPRADAATAQHLAEAAADAGTHGQAHGGPVVQGDDGNVFALLREMLRALRPAPAAEPLRPERGERNERRALATTEMLSVLSLMQTEVPPAVLETMERHEASLSVLLKRDLLQSAARIGLSPDQVRLHPDEEDAVDLVGMLFDVLFDEHDFEQRARNLVSRLVVPYVKVALLDRQMFMYRTHPARRLLNAVTEACEGNGGQSAQDREMLGKAEQIVDTLVADFNEDVAIFETLESELRSSLEAHQKRVELAERRAAEAQRGQERLEQARVQAGGEVASRVDGRRVPAALREFLARSWSHHLSLVVLREGADSGSWAAALALADKLLDLLPGGKAAGVGLATAMQGLGADLVAVLASSGVQGEAADQVISAIAEGIEAQRRGDAVAAQQAAAVLRVAPEPPLVPVPRLKVVGGTEAHGAPDPDDLARLRELKVGDWVSLAGEDDKPAPAKLAWISPISNRLMFVNRRGVRMLVASVEELAALKKLGRLVLREAQGGAFEDALQRMVGRLQKDSA